MHTVPAPYESLFTITVFTVLAFAIRPQAERGRSNLRAHSVRVAMLRDGKVDRRTCKNFSQPGIPDLRFSYFPRSIEPASRSYEDFCSLVQQVALDHRPMLVKDLGSSCEDQGRKMSGWFT